MLFAILVEYSHIIKSSVYNTFESQPITDASTTNDRSTTTAPPTLSLLHLYWESKGHGIWMWASGLVIGLPPQRAYVNGLPPERACACKKGL
ncbi:hypothetical protein LguiB_006165 [Lonicera macranthoides]